MDARLQQQQIALINHGFSCGACGADGLIGGDTRRAIEACKGWQRALNTYGFNCGPADGWPGPLFDAAKARCVEIQNWLNTYGFSVGAADGYPLTLFEDGLKAFQRDSGCTMVDGIYGPETASHMATWRQPVVSPTPTPAHAGYPIVEELIHNNRPGTALSPQGLAIHDTEDPGASAQNIRDYFNGGNRSASAHYCIDWASIVQMIPENEMAWHAGPTANRRFLSIEMCVPAGHNPEQFNEVWNRAVFLAAVICGRYGLSVDKIYSHHMVSNMFRETDHTDPDGYFAEYGKNFDMFRADVAALLAG